MPVFEERKRKAVEASAPTFASFQAALRARTGLLAAEAGVPDESAFKASVEPQGPDAWIGGFIRANGLVDLKPIQATKADLCEDCKKKPATMTVEGARLWGLAARKKGLPGRKWAS